MQKRTNITLGLRQLLGLLVGVICLIGSTEAWGQTPVSLPVQGSLQLWSGSQLYFFEDPTASLTHVHVNTDPYASQFKSLDGESPHFGYTDSAIWLRFRITQATEENVRKALLGVARGDLRELDVFFVEPSGKLVASYAVGANRGFEERPIKHRNFLFPIPSSTSAELVVLVRAASVDALHVPITIEESEAFWIEDAGYLIIHGVYMGIVLLMIFVSLFLYWATRYRPCLVYAVYISFIGLIFTVIRGLTFQYFWPSFPLWQIYCAWVCVAGLVISAVVFNLEFLEITKSRKVLWTAHWLCAGAGALGVLLLIFAPYLIAVRVILAAGIFMAVLTLTAGVYRWREGYLPAMIFTLASGVFLCGGVLLGVQVVVYISDHWFIRYAMQMGSAIQIVLLALAVASRMRYLQGQRMSMAVELEYSNEMLLQSQKLATLGELVASVGHEINSPMNYIMMSGEHIQENVTEIQGEFAEPWDDKGQSKEWRETIRTRLAEIESLIEESEGPRRQLLEISQALRQHSRIDEELVKDIDLNDVVSESLLLMKGKLVGMDVQPVLGSLPPVTCRRSQIGQVVANLLSNAADAVAEEGETQSNSFTGRVRVETQAFPKNGQDGVLILIADNGGGITEETKAKIFDSFFTTKPVGIGTGLGLPICQKILTAHGGTIDVSSDEELGGAVFECWVPVSPA